MREENARLRQRRYFLQVIDAGYARINEYEHVDAYPHAHEDAHADVSAHGYADEHVFS